MNLKIPYLVHFLGLVLLLVMLKVSTGDQPCSTGFTGNNCSVNIDDCISINCSGNGNCSDRVNGYFCFCFHGFFGMNCEKDADKCFPERCENGGTCYHEGDLLKCNCTAAYEGERCESKKPSITFSVIMTLRSRQYISDFADLTKPTTRAIIADLTDIFTPFFNKTFQEFLQVIFTRFSPGSLVTNFDIYFEPTANVTKTSIIQALERGNGTKDLQFEILDKITFASGNPDKVETLETTEEDSSPSKLATWILVLIIAGVIYFILLLILIVLIVLYRRKDNQDPKRRRRSEMVVIDGSWSLTSQKNTRTTLAE